MTTAIGVSPPARIPVAVRAMAPVAANPPKKGATMFPKPSPTSSASGSCRPPAIPSATTAHSNDSIAPSRAMANAVGARSEISDRPNPDQGTVGRGNLPGTPPN